MNNTPNKVRDVPTWRERVAEVYPAYKHDCDRLPDLAQRQLRDCEIADLREALRDCHAFQVAQEMDQVAITHAHGLALDLECILADDYHGKWYDSALNQLASYRAAMNAIHERESPTFLGEPVIHDGPSSLAQQVKNAQMKIAAWSPEKRASVKLEGGLK